MLVRLVARCGMAMDTHPVLFFDGECGLCNRCVRRLLNMDRRGVLRFGALQGPDGQAYLRSQGLPSHEFSSLMYVPRWPADASVKPLLRTDGVIAALRACGGRGTFYAGLLSLVPRPVRDFGYRVIAKTRYRFFGPWKACPLPRPEWASRFIDGAT